MIKTISLIVGKVQVAAGAAACIALIVLMALVLLSTATRTLGITATFAEEFIRYDVILLVSLGMGYTFLRDGYVRVGEPNPAGFWGRCSRLLTNLISIALIVFVIGSLQGLWSLSKSWGLKSNTDWAVPLWPMHFLLYAGFIALLFQMIVDSVVLAVSIVSNHKHPVDKDAIK